MKAHSLNDINELRRLWFDVYDGPVLYAPMSAFERIDQLQQAIRDLHRIARSGESDIRAIGGVLDRFPELDV